MIVSVGLLLASGVRTSNLILFIGNVGQVQGQEFPITGESESFCSDGSPPDATTGLCPEGNFPPGPPSSGSNTTGQEQEQFCSDNSPPYPNGTCPDYGQSQPSTGDDSSIPSISDQTALLGQGATNEVNTGPVLTQADDASVGTSNNFSVGKVSNFCNPASPTLTMKTKGPEVTNLQNALIQLGHNVGINGADGIFGSDTQKAVLKFQQDNGLTPNGVVDISTWTASCTPASLPPFGGAAPQTGQTPPPPDGGQGSTSSDDKTVSIKWIHDPKASVLDKLPSGNDYRTFKWERYDMPGKNKAPESKFPDPDPGPDENKARKMFSELQTLIPERRPTAGATAVFCVAKDGRCGPQPEQMNEKIWNHILGKDILITADKKGHKLNKYAAASFARMVEAARNDGVELEIHNSDRSCAASKTSSENLGSGSGTVIADCPNSHNFGLAIDFYMRQDDWPLHPAFEISTGPFSNIIKMMESPVYKWLSLNAKTYDWYPYIYEPWHWEYNSPGFRSQFFAGCNCDPKSPS